MTHALDAAISTPIEHGDLPHLCGLVIRGEEIVYEGTAGGAGIDRIFRIASMTKALTSVAVMQCVERGLVMLDGALDDYLTREPSRVLAGFDGQGQAQFRAPARAPRIRELLTHTGGYGYGVWNETLCRYFEGRGEVPIGPSGAARLTAPMVADAGTAWHYSIATDFLGQVVETVTGCDLDSYMKDAIFEPLGMTDTSFDLAPGADDRLMTAYRREDDATLAAIELPRPQANGFCSGGGGLTSTPQDYARFLAAMLNLGALHGTRILESGTVENMFTNHTGDLPIPGMRSYDPRSSASYEFFPELRKGWGLGFLLNLEHVPDRRRAGSGTWAGLFNTHFWIDRSAGIAGLLMTQLLPFCDPAFMRAYDAFEAAAYPA